MAIVNRYIITLEKDEPHGEERDIQVVAETSAEAELLALAVEGEGWLWWGSRLDKANV